MDEKKKKKKKGEFKGGKPAQPGTSPEKKKK
jgi:hypothetical protein